jgi:glycosyltransferase involved in cell wall biosynthesis
MTTTGYESGAISIGFDAKRAFFNTSGLGNYSRNLLSALVRHFPINSYLLFTPKIRNHTAIDNEDRFSIIGPRSLVMKMTSQLWRRKFVTGEIRRLRPDIYHGLSQELPLGIEKTGVKSIVTVHDLIFIRYPGYYHWFDAGIYTRKLIHACRICDRVVAISKQTREDLIDFLKVPPEKITVLYQGCNPRFSETLSDSYLLGIRKKYNLPARYLLYVSTLVERKNLLGLLKALNELKIDIPLVVIGRKTMPYYNKIMDFITRHKMNNIMFPGAILNTELPAIYRNAECFIYPSFFEGFGIPVVEALVSGTPVITSKGGCFTEAAGPGSLYVDPANPGEIGNAIIEVVNNSNLRERMIQQGIAHAGNFSPEVIAGSYMDLYHSVMK